jgi:hypothetical protein
LLKMRGDSPRFDPASQIVGRVEYASAEPLISRTCSGFALFEQAKARQREEARRGCRVDQRAAR